jgi:transcriptional regulator with XRE-family HTH domain
MAKVRYKQIMTTFAQQLRKAREAAGYGSAQQFAALLNLEPHTYRHYERGEREPNLETLHRICALLKVTPNDLLPIAASEGSTPDGDEPGPSKAAA